MVKSRAVSLPKHTFSSAGIVLLAVNQYLCTFIHPTFLSQQKGTNDLRNYFKIMEDCYQTRDRTCNLLITSQVDAHPTEPPRWASSLIFSDNKNKNFKILSAAVVLALLRVKLFYVQHNRGLYAILWQQRQNQPGVKMS